MAGDSEQRLEEQGQPSGGEPFLIGVSGGTASGKVRGERGAGIGCTRRPRARAAATAAPRAPPPPLLRGTGWGLRGRRNGTWGSVPSAGHHPAFPLTLHRRAARPLAMRLFFTLYDPTGRLLPPPSPRARRKEVRVGGCPFFCVLFLGYFSFWRGTLGHRVASC